MPRTGLHRRPPVGRRGGRGRGAPPPEQPARDDRCRTGAARVRRCRRSTTMRSGRGGERWRMPPSASADDPRRVLAASACRPPLLDSWLVGGSGATGAADLVLAHESRHRSGDGANSPFSARLRADAAGRASTSWSRPARGAQARWVVPPRGASPSSEETPVVRVSAVGAPIRASLVGEHHAHAHPRRRRPGRGPIAQADTTEVITGVTVTRRSGEDGPAPRAALRRTPTTT